MIICHLITFGTVKMVQWACTLLVVENGRSTIPSSLSEYGDAETGEYIEREDYSPSWDHDLRMFDDWLALGWGWDGDYLDYRRVHE